MHKKPLIIDVDGSDGSLLALVLACASEELSVEGVTCTGRWGAADRTAVTVARLCEYLQIELPIYVGNGRPLCSRSHLAAQTGEEPPVERAFLPPAEFLCPPQPAAEFMAEVIRGRAGEICLAAVAPLTDLADLAIAYPQLCRKVDRVVIAGGGTVRGDRTPAAEHNIWCDPEAAQIVFRSGMPLIMCGTDVETSCYMCPTERSGLYDRGGDIGRLVAELAKDAACLRRAAAIYVLCRPDEVNLRRYPVEIDLNGAYTRGSTVALMSGYYPDKVANTDVVLALVRQRFVQWLFDTAASADRRRQG